MLEVVFAVIWILGALMALGLVITILVLVAAFLADCCGYGQADRLERHREEDDHLRDRP